jgi:hypothetical protein
MPNQLFHLIPSPAIAASLDRDATWWLEECWVVAPNEARAQAAAIRDLGTAVQKRNGRISVNPWTQPSLVSVEACSDVPPFMVEDQVYIQDGKGAALYPAR